MKKTTLRNLFTLVLVMSLCVMFALGVSADDTLPDMTPSEAETATLLDEPEAYYGTDINNLASSGTLKNALENVPDGGYIRLDRETWLTEAVIANKEFTLDLCGNHIYFSEANACFIVEDGGIVTVTNSDNTNSVPMFSYYTCAIEVKDGGELIINNSNFISDTDSPTLIVNEGGKATLNGGDFTVWENTDSVIYNEGTLVLDGVYVINNNSLYSIENLGELIYKAARFSNDDDAVADIVLTSGTIDFSDADATSILGISIRSTLDEPAFEEAVTFPAGVGYEMVEGEGYNTYTLITTYKAMVDDVLYTTIEEAIAAADVSGESVILQKNIKGFEVDATDSLVYINLNGYDIKGDDYAITVNDGARLYIYNTIAEDNSYLYAENASIKLNGGDVLLYYGGFSPCSGLDEETPIPMIEYYDGRLGLREFFDKISFLNKAEQVSVQDMVVFENDIILTEQLEEVETLEQDTVYYAAMGAPSLYKSSVAREKTDAKVNITFWYSVDDGTTCYYYKVVEKGTPAPTADELIQEEKHELLHYDVELDINDIEESDELELYYVSTLYNDVLGTTFVGNVNKIDIGKYVVTYPLWIGGVRVDENNLDDVMGDGAVSYDPETNTLTLDNYTYDGADYYTYENSSGEYGAIIYTTDSLTIELEGENILEAADDFAEGIVVRNLEEDESTTLDIIGDGSLDIITESRDAFYIECTEIHMTVGEDVTLNLRPGDEEGIYLDSAKASLTVEGNAVIDVENEEECIYFSCNCYDEVCVCEHTMLVTDNAHLVLKNSDEEGIYMTAAEGTLTIEDGARFDIAVYENAIDVGSLYINGGYIVAISEGESGYSCISLNTELVMTEGVLIAVSTISPAIYAPYIKISGGEAALLSTQSAISSETENGIDTSEYEKEHRILARLSDADEYEDFDPEYAYDYSIILIMPDEHYIITFDANDGKTDTNVMYTYGGKLEKLPRATRSGYAFSGWFAEGDDGEYAVTTETVFEEDTVVYAKWEEITSSGTTIGSITNTTRNPDGSVTKSTYNIKKGTTTETTEHTDGTTTVVVIQKDGTSTSTHTAKDGTTTVITKLPDGDSTTEITNKDNAVVVISTPADGTPTIKVKTQGESEVFIPLVGASKVTAVVLTNEKGEVTKVTDIEASDDGVKLTVTENATVTFEVNTDPDNEASFDDIKDNEPDNEASFDDIKDNTPDNETKFEDIENHWANEAIEYVVKAAIMNGVDEASFAPDENVTRAMLVTVLYRLEGEPATNRSIPFGDVDMGGYYASAVIWAKQNGIVNGTSYEEFSPNDYVLREQIAAILHRYAVYKGYDVSVGENTNILSYEDANEVSEYAIAPMQYVIGSGIINGKTEATIAPQEFATRAEIATILHRFMEVNK